ncbi:two-component system response regulator [Methylomonas koyamae]|uniref:Two-component system response regulator n=1 Tax=Methylomonas koyamae TaxID=702114 RepID=A0A177N4M2_9GAMM|nr:two-component system response regulator [Methylomonas koyamae]OAI12433.1 two-component system response regulator [Methylomonas koyamae]
MTQLYPTPAQPVILIVDDTPENITVLGELLQPYYTVKVATDGRRALASAIKPPHPDLILLDVMMPELDGYAVLARLREAAETRDIPVVFVTALDASEDESRGLELGAADYITKPIRPPIVLARVRAQLELKQARDRLRDQNQWLEGEVARRLQQNQKIQDVSIRALASLAETRDNETGNHILRTQGYVGVLCDELAGSHFSGRLDARTVELITKAAPLHDIGKVGIPDHVLLKPGKLNDDEWQLMRTHAKLGAEAISRAIRGEPDQSSFDFLHTAIEIAHYHHEKWDGSGYPDGLCGDAIPLPARLMALADVFDALINRRCYKAPMAIEQAAAIIADGKNSHFDPRVVDAFANRLDQFATIAERYADKN